MEHDSQLEVYFVRVWIREIHPMLWRRFLVRSDSTLADSTRFEMLSLEGPLEKLYESFD